MPVRKRAVDATTKAYWTAYLGPYGKQLTDKVPRRIAGVLAEGLRRQASRDEGLKVVQGQIAPLAVAGTEGGGVVLDGVFRCATERRGRNEHRIIAFQALVDADGELKKISTRTA